MKIAQINNYNYSRNNNYQTLAVKKQNEQSPNTTALQNQYNQPSFGKNSKSSGYLFFLIAAIILGVCLLVKDLACLHKVKDNDNLTKYNETQKEILKQIEITNDSITNELNKKTLNILDSLPKTRK